MTITSDPKHPLYLDEADVRDEMSRVFDLCNSCRLCVTFCSSFPTLFEMIDRHGDPDAGLMTPAEQDQVVDECFQCKRCYVNCPYVPARHESQLDFPRLMLRAAAMQHEQGITSTRSKVTTQVMARTDLLGRVATAVAPLANAIVGAEPGSTIRKITAKITGLSAVRLLPPYATQRFSTWFANRPRVLLGDRQGRVTVYPTCLVEYRETDIGKDLVKVYERNGIECNISGAGCCGAPWLHAGDIEQFTKVAEKNIATLAKEIRAGTEVVIAQPACSYVVKQDYVAYVGGPDADLVAAHTSDAVEYLMNVHRADDTVLDTDFDGEIVGKITYHAPSHLRAQNIGFESRDLMKLTGAKVKMVQQCSGADGMWGHRAENDALSIPVAKKLGALIVKADGDAVAGDSHLANTAILEQTGRAALHPLQVIARAYGIAEDRS